MLSADNLCESWQQDPQAMILWDSTLDLQRAGLAFSKVTSASLSFQGDTEIVSSKQSHECSKKKQFPEKSYLLDLTYLQKTPELFHEEFWTLAWDNTYIVQFCGSSWHWWKGTLESFPVNMGM